MFFPQLDCPVEPVLADLSNEIQEDNESQGQTLPRVILCVSLKPGSMRQMNYSSLYVAITRVKKSDHIPLLLYGGTGDDAVEVASQHMLSYKWGDLLEWIENFRKSDSMLDYFGSSAVKQRNEGLPGNSSELKQMLFFSRGRERYLWSAKETTDFKAVECYNLNFKVFQMCKRFGMPSTFLTLSPRDVDNSRVFPTSFQTVGNKSFPAVFDETSPYAKNTHEFMNYLPEGPLDLS